MKLAQLLFVNFFFLFFLQTYSAQEVYLRKIADINKIGNDKFLYNTPEKLNTSQYLGELEVVGIARNNQELFTKIYNKAKEIGANSYSLKNFENIDGTLQDIDVSHFKLNLYYTPSQDIVQNSTIIYILSNNTPKKIRINRSDVNLNSDTYIKKTLLPGDELTISTIKLLGSTIKISTNNQKLPQYFQVLGFNIKENDGISLKSGDIKKLDTSYGQFLVLISKEQNAQ